jgi:outer membrane protein TolC
MVSRAGPLVGPSAVPSDPLGRSTMLHSRTSRRLIRLTTVARSSLFLVVLLPACADSYSAGVEDDARALLDERIRGMGEERASTVIQPKPSAEPAQSQPASRPASRSTSRPAGPELDLAASLRTAVRSNREYLTRREGLLRQGFGLQLTRFQFGPQFQSAVSYLWGGQEVGPNNHLVSGTLGVSQILPTGGTLDLNSLLSTTRSDGIGISPLNDKSYNTNVGIRLSQPLLRGFGREASHEPLTQAERSLLYAVRDFELYRQSFVITVARSYYELVSLEQTLGNEEDNHQQAGFDRVKAEALRGVDRNTDQEVFRARRRELEALDRLIEVRAAYERALDEFKIQLGQDLGQQYAIARGEPPFVAVRLDLHSAVLAARQNRLDLITERQRLEDAERAVRIAGQDLLPDMNLVAGYNLSGADDVLSGAAPDTWSANVGVSLELPLQRLPSKQAYRTALLDLGEARRGLTLKLDQLELDVRDQLRRLASVEQRIALQTEQIGQEQRAVMVTRIRYESGELDNRDLLEARQSLIEAQNTLIRLRLDHFIGRLSLLRDLGLLFLDEDGMWK